MEWLVVVLDRWGTQNRSQQVNIKRKISLGYLRFPSVQVNSGFALKEYKKRAEILNKCGFLADDINVSDNSTHNQ